jgi:glycosyltransferase involved in cell wall biosynthesis
MFVSQVMAGAARGGAETFFERLVIALHDAGLNQDIIIRRNEERATLLRERGLSPKELRFGGPIDVLSRWQLKRHLKQTKPDIVLSWMSRAAAMTPAGDYVHCARLGGYYKLKYFRTCDHLIGNTQDIVDYLVGEGWPADRAHYLPNFVPDIRAPAIDRASLDTPEEAPLFLSLGRLHENKAFDVLLDALAKVPDAYLWLAGIGPLEIALKTQADRLGIAERVRFLGWRTDTPALLAASDYVVVPSRIEPLGNVVLEAWAQSRPLIAARSKGPAALIKDHQDGLLVDIDDSGQLADVMMRVIADPALGDKLTKSGRLRFDADFTEAAVVQKYLDFFAKIQKP